MVVAEVATVVVVVRIDSVGLAEGLVDGDVLGEDDLLKHDVNSSKTICLPHVLPNTLVASVLLDSSKSCISAFDIRHKHPMGSDASEVQYLFRIRTL